MDIARTYTQHLSSYADLILDHLPLGIALFDAHDLRLLSANTAYQAFLEPAWQQGHALGYTLDKFLPQQATADANDFFNIAVFRRVVASGQKYHARSNYSLARGNTYWDWTLEPLSDEQGTIIHLLLTIREAAPGQANEEVPEQEAHSDGTGQSLPPVNNAQSESYHVAIGYERQRLYTILDQLPGGVLLVEATTSKINYANPAAAQLLGLPLSRLIGIPLNQSAVNTGVDHQLVARWNFVLIQALSGKIVPSQELLVRRSDGSSAALLSAAAPIYTPGGIISEAVLVFQDITAQKQLERQKNEFFVIANHELRTPLTAIMGFSEILQLQARNKETDTAQRYAIDSIATECEHMTQLIEEMLDAFRLEQTSLKIHPGQQELLGFLTQLVERYTHTVRTHNIRFVLEDLSSSERLIGRYDRGRIEQVMKNLISNAVKYSPWESRIEVGLRPYRRVGTGIKEVLIWVKDQGVGIPEPEIPLIFERFYRAGNQDPSISGFGIGLYISRELVRGHGGHIWVESSEGEGSTFFVMLPLDGTAGK
ncbi:PAS domain-containing protein [Ktedonosporobacter rubrisoli]|uniref:histidine kinase n=1 Tax=Ktedonosporobacter rubrisoli TaxID=2509675 RepID=A0A4P6JVM9_KTERU|nr:ATP-binding protein [Ktedonosporobacter rubrisoli]QBD79717.1 PAS domain-containing protein [Ktedonosporobacter rubrisoli]